MRGIFSTLLFVTLSFPASAQMSLRNDFNAYEGPGCQKRESVVPYFKQQIPGVVLAHSTSSIEILKHPDIATYLELFFNSDGCFIGTMEIDETQFILLRDGV